MIYSILSYGNPLLKKSTKDIDEKYNDLDTIIDNMWKTMYNAKGVGLAAPQIGLSISLFVVDGTPFVEDENINEFDKTQLKNLKKVIINPILNEFGENWIFNEGCLSIPNIREDVSRKNSVNIKYYDQKFNFHEEVYSGLAARIIQHEYDHLKGILFIDKLSQLKRQMIKGRLNKISKGKIETDYLMKFYKGR
ncbi:MAG: peptide deformylase [Bacteroidota bacterium]|nr:peptide deformylase [Flavobacteriaceae bacterium]MEC7870381.1 peptide deformylase [Bacteroidota bacterium]MEC8615427.1 peptide deformylase [Bacteroidota bacterium]|tara:strand:+ start:2748 stop:3326 length:579 start_codon:yes stop_codon:yes gene_type:complete